MKWFFGWINVKLFCVHVSWICLPCSTPLFFVHRETGPLLPVGGLVIVLRQFFWILKQVELHKWHFTTNIAFIVVYFSEHSCEYGKGKKTLILFRIKICPMSCNPNSLQFRIPVPWVPKAIFFRRGGEQEMRSCGFRIRLLKEFLLLIIYSGIVRFFWISETHSLPLSVGEPGNELAEYLKWGLSLAGFLWKFKPLFGK